MSKIHLASGAISILGTCTLACRHCYSGSSPSVKNQFSFEEISAFLKAFSDKGISHIFIGGGEPFLHPELVAVVQAASLLNMKVALSSNGHLITSEVLDSLFNAGLSHDLSLSLDGDTSAINDRVRGKSSFVGTLQGMLTTNQFGKILWGVNYVACRPNLGHALNTALLAQRMGASYFNLIRFTVSGRGNLQRVSLEITDEEYDQEVSSMVQFDSFGNFYGDVILFSLREGLSESATSYFDNPTFEGLPSGISIEHSGKVELTPAKILLGNCKTEPMEDILQRIDSEETQGIYEQWLRHEWRGVHQPRLPGS